MNHPSSSSTGASASRTLRVVGDPRPQARPRLGRYGNAYSPKTPWFREVARLASACRPDTPWTGAVRLDIDFVFRVPKAGGRSGPVLKRPDLDNLEKAVMDALTAARWWIDDSQVYLKATTKRWAAEGEEPGAYIRAEEVA